METQLARHRAMMALTELNDAQREVLFLSVVHDHTTGQIADLLGLSYDTVYARLKRARRLFNRALDTINEA